MNKTGYIFCKANWNNSSSIDANGSFLFFLHFFREERSEVFCTVADAMKKIKENPSRWKPRNFGNF